MADWFVGPNPSLVADGTPDRPWSLDYAIGNIPNQPATRNEPDRVPSVIKEGDTINLLSGLYSGAFDCHPRGVTIQSAPGHWAKLDLGGIPIDGNGGRRFFVWGSGATIQNMEFFCSNGARRTDQVGSWPTDVTRAGLTTYADDINFIGLLCHNLGGVLSSKSGGSVVDCIFHSCGWLGKDLEGKDNPHGHGLYVQNFGFNGKKKLIRGNISFSNFGYGIHCYGTDATQTGLRNITVEENICFDNGGAAGWPFSHFPNLLLGGQVPVEDCNVSENITFQSARDGVTRFGYPWGPQNKNITIADNIFADGRFCFEKDIKNMVAFNNTIFGTIENNGKVSWNSSLNQVSQSLPAVDKSLVVIRQLVNGTYVVVTVGGNVFPKLSFSEGQQYTVIPVCEVSTVTNKPTYIWPEVPPPKEVSLPRPIGYSLRSKAPLSNAFGCWLVTPVGSPVPPDPTTPEEPIPTQEYLEIKLPSSWQGKVSLENNTVKVRV